MKPIQPPQTPSGPQRPPQKFGPASDLEDTFGGILDAADVMFGFILKIFTMPADKHVTKCADLAKRFLEVV